MASNTPENPIEDPVREELSRFMDFALDRNIFSGRWIGSVLGAFNPNDPASLAPEQLLESFNAGGLAAVKAKLLLGMGQHDYTFPRYVSERELAGFIAYDPKKTADEIDTFEAENSLPEDRSHWDPQG